MKKLKHRYRHAFTFSNRKQETGSMSLTTIASSAGAVLFTMLMINFVRYTIATGTVEQAAHATLRCLTPSDADCRDISLTPIEPPENLRWFGQNKEQLSTKWADRYLYEAKVFEQDWEARFDTYEIHKVIEPPILWSSYLVPQRTFTPIVSRHEYRRSHVAMTARTYSVHSVYKPLYEPNFPVFNPDYEFSRQDLPIWSWAPQVLAAESTRQQLITRDTSLPFRWFTFSPSIVPAGTQRRFSSPIVSVSALERRELKCINREGSSCDISGRAGGRKEDWRDWAFLAIKAFAHVRKTPSQEPWRETYMQWGILPRGAGLTIDIWYPGAGRDPNRPSTSMCLGGRAPTGRLNEHGRWYNLWLRGPVGANGGSNAICPGGRVQHWPIAVPRGGSFRINAYLSSAGGTANALVHPAIGVYFDEYSLEQIPQSKLETKVCPKPVRLAKANQGLSCPTPTECGFTGAVAKVENCWKIGEPLPPQAVCLSPEQAAKDPFAFELTQINCGENVRTAVCKEGWTPHRKPNCAPPAGRIICGAWALAANDRSYVEVGEAADCPLARHKTNKAYCSGGKKEIIFRSDQDYGNLFECPAVIKARENSHRSVTATNKDQTAGAPTFASLSDSSFRWGEPEEFSPPKWQASYALPGNNQGSQGNSLEIRKINHKFKNSQKILARSRDEWQPSLGSFKLQLPPGLGAVPADHPVTFHKIGAKREIVLDAAYPFKNKPEFKVPPFLPSEKNLANCSGEEVSSEHLMRYYASKQVPKTMNLDVEFWFRAEYHSSALAGDGGSCGTGVVAVSEFPRCTEFSESLEEIFCNEQDLGIFPTKLLPMGPPACTNGTFDRCRAEAIFNYALDDSDQNLFNPNLDRTKAIQRGFLELERSFPGTQSGCKDAGCAEVIVSENDSPYAEVSVRYYLPIGFPLSQLIGADSIPIEYQKREVFELAQRVAE